MNENMTSMFGLKFRLTVALLLCLAAVSCMKMEDNVDREILFSTVWIGERFYPADMPGVGETVLYSFDKSGILYIYKVADQIGEPIERLRYIYQSEKRRIVIENYGAFLVTELDVDRLIMDSNSGTIDLSFYSDSDIID